ncbi:type I methionyl aminopeptidase [Clostridium vitabionis]|uniref:type I methionyl aminopeptidase n=1 Tax=Clostridium vitabionis TaxID=2784388 RepID=UPI00188C5605|nr:type I methionyl aminopeptidase [Clostridium vitabionis]
MAVIIKSPTEIRRMREAGRLLEEVYLELAEKLAPGMTTAEIDRIGEELILKRGCIPSCKGYEGFPAAFCISVNDEVVHGIPSEARTIEDGDIVSLDTCLVWKGYQADAARTFPIGNVAEEDLDLIRTARESFFAGIRFAKPGYHIRDISRAIQNYVERRGYGVVRDLEGHGIGADMHEDPEIPNYVTRRRGVTLKPGMTLAIEPMITEGDWLVGWMDDGWTVVTLDGSNAAHYENTVLITEGEPEIFTYSGEAPVIQE